MFSLLRSWFQPGYAQQQLLLTPHAPIAYSQHPVAPIVREGTQTQVHEVFVAVASDATTSDAENQKRRLRAEQIEEDGWDEGWYL